MAQKKPQTFANHRRYVVGYHVVTLLLLFVNLAWWFYHTVTQFSVANLVALFLAIGVVMLALYARTFALGAQDRVIRLEERLRYAEILPEELKPVVANFSVDQIVSLRFASDEELAELVRVVSEQNLTKRDEIKKLIGSWKADYQRI
jgi:hypothetical protein